MPTSAPERKLACRFCSAPLTHSFVDLGTSPLCNATVTADKQGHPESFFPLHAFVCDRCFLVQLDEFVAPDNIFGDGNYSYFSSYSDSWLAHAKAYTEMMIDRFGLTSQSQVVEIASNDGYLLQYFVARQIKALGIEPASNCADAARQKGVESVQKFFGQQTAREVAAQYGKADVLLGNNVLAHVPDINDFVAGMKILLAKTGVLTMEFPHLLRLVEGNQFDTIYHEHFSYLSFGTVSQIFAHHGLTLWDVEELPTHGGSLRIFGKHSETAEHPLSERAQALLAFEAEAGLRKPEYYDKFAEQVRETKRKLLAFLIEAKRKGKTVVGYGAPGKGNTLLNYCGIRRDMLDYTVDRSPVKQGTFLPGTRIPILAPEAIFQSKPDYVLILPWNLEKEITSSMGKIKEWGGKFVVPIPEARVLD
jgi:C-methyltransferase C-terminal domain/Putative zinc binding domain/Methyltransferase domain